MISRSRRVLAVNLFLATVSAVLVVYIVRQILVPMPRVTPRPMIAAVRPAEPTRTSADGGRPQATSYSVIAVRNLFSPTRSESAESAASAPPPPASLPSPVLKGVIVNGETSIAYLEDPTSKRVFGYRVGDAVAGRRVEEIAADHVKLAGAQGPVAVRLHEPGKRRVDAPTPSVILPTEPPAFRGSLPAGPMPPGGPMRR